MKSSTATKVKDIERDWYLVDLKDKVLGRISTDIAKMLMGKSKSYYVRNLDCGDYVVVVNAREVKVTGNKEDQKKYYRHSGYPGGFREETFKKLMSRRPEEIIKHAVRGMLPQNKLRDRLLKRLKIFADGQHSYEDKFKKSEKKEDKGEN